MDDLLIPDTAPKPEYRVLARKYRPASFDALIGQDAMVRTLGNSIRRGQLAQAWLLTGVRGVGKTSTARIIAKALNCVGPDGQGGPTISPCGTCEPCIAIAAGRHIDIVEMDAASNTGIGDIREIIEAVRYAAVSARYKIYIIDEVHMLSNQAFNGLLKTLEEPPPHVKFIFATTEVHKLPVTVLSRCQRFDLRRIPAEQLAAHFAAIVAAEGATADAEALALIARAAEGSVRDGLSILDQAIAHGSGTVDGAAVRDMLGLSDRGSVRALMALVLAGDAAGALAALGAQLDLGTDPAMIVQELLGLVHTVTRAKIAGDAPDPAMSAEEREAVQGWAATLSFPAVHRLWQLLLKGLAEVQAAPVPGQAAEMAVLRIIHASSLPDPGELVRRLSERGDGGEAPALPAERPSGAIVQQLREPPPAPTPAPLPADFEALVGLFETRREPRLAHLLHDEVRVVDFAPPLLSISGSTALPPDFAQRIMACLLLWTATRWTVTMVQGAAAPTMHEAAGARIAADRAAALADPAVQEILAAFPNAELTDISFEEPRSAADA
jgi:DNA polymerase-3 subunit gamma/tau